MEVGLPLAHKLTANRLLLFLLCILHLDKISGALEDLLPPALDALDGQGPHFAGETLHL